MYAKVFFIYLESNEIYIFFSVIAILSPYPSEEGTPSSMETFVCGETHFVRTSGGTNCLNGEDEAWCYKLNLCTSPFELSDHQPWTFCPTVCTSPFKHFDDQQWFQYCQTLPTTPAAAMQKSEITSMWANLSILS